MGRISSTAIVNSIRGDQSDMCEKQVKIGLRGLRGPECQAAVVELGQPDDPTGPKHIQGSKSGTLALSGAEQRLVWKG